MIKAAKAVELVSPPKVVPVMPGSFIKELIHRDVSVRSAGIKDLKAILPLAREMNSINLPCAEGVLRQRLLLSDASFENIERGGGEEHFQPGFFQFVAEEVRPGTSEPKPIGACNITGMAGTEDNPYLYYLLKDGILTLQQLPFHEGPTTFGGIILDEDYRGNRFFPFSKLLSYARCWFLMRHSEIFRYPIFAEILPIKTGPRERQNNFWSWVSQPEKNKLAGAKEINLTYEQITRQVHLRTKMLKAHLPKVIPLESMSPAVARDFDLAKEESRPAQRNLERIYFRPANRYYVVDAGIIIEAKLQNLIFWRSGMQAGYPRVCNNYFFDMIGLVGTTSPETGHVRLTLTPYSIVPGNPSYIYLPGEKMRGLGFDRNDTPGLVHALPVPLYTFESFFGGAGKLNGGKY